MVVILAVGLASTLKLDVLGFELVGRVLEELGTLVNLGLFLDALGLVDVLLVGRDFELVGLAVE